MRRQEYGILAVPRALLRYFPSGGLGLQLENLEQAELARLMWQRTLR
jgi:hypothetical protein